MQRWTWVHYALFMHCETMLQRKQQRGGGPEVRQFISGNVVEFDAIEKRLKERKR